MDTTENRIPKTTAPRLVINAAAPIAETRQGNTHQRDHNKECRQTLVAEPIPGRTDLSDIPELRSTQGTRETLPRIIHQPPTVNKA